MDRTPPSATAATITLEGVGKRYDDGTVAVGALSLDIAAGDLVVAHRAVRLRQVHGAADDQPADRADQRAASADGEDMPRRTRSRLRRRIGYVIQNVGLFPHQTIATNVGTVPRLLGWPKAKIRERTAELLELVGLDPARYGKRYPHELSGGQRQRVGVARALAADPVVLLMDEPFSAVDPIVRVRLQDEFLRLQREVRKTIVFVTHDLDEAVRLADEIAVLSEGGVLEQYATPAELLRAPANTFVIRVRRRGPWHQAAVRDGDRPGGPALIRDVRAR